MGEEILDRLVAGVEEFDEDENAIVGKVGGLAELLDLAFRECRVGTLSVKRQSESEENESEEETTEHWFLCRIDNGTTGMSLLREDGLVGLYERTDRPSFGEPDPITRSQALVFEDFGEEFVVDLIELLEGDLERGLIFAGGFVEILAEAIGGVVEEHLGVLEALAVAGEIHVDELRVVVDLLERGAGLVDVAVEHLPACDLGHGVDELGVEEALVARAGLLGAKFELGQGLGVGKIFVDGGGVNRSAEGRGTKAGEEGQRRNEE